MRASTLRHDTKIFIVKNLEETQTLVQNDEGPLEFVLVEDTDIMSGRVKSPKIIVGYSMDDLQGVYEFMGTGEKSNMKTVEVDASIRLYARPGDLL